MQQADEVIAILTADWHLSLKPPVWRSAEPDWLDAQSRVLTELNDLSRIVKCPIICAGDIFDKWNSSAELINYAIDYLYDTDSIYAIPGQHDLPNHNYEDIHRSAYQTLVNADIIDNIPHKESIEETKSFVLHGFPFGCPLTLLKNAKPNMLHIAVVHEYKWIEGCKYPGAPDESKLKTPNTHNEIYSGGKWMGYDVVVYGDNHKGFLTHIGNTTIFNCGTLMRRASDEKDYIPQVGLLMADGSVKIHCLDTSQDKYLPTDAKIIDEKNLDMAEFFEELEKLGKTALDFKEAMKEFLHRGKTVNEVKQIIFDAMEK